MKNIVILYKTDDDDIYCHEVSKEGLEHIENPASPMFFKEGVAISLDVLEEILDKEVFVE